MGVIEAVRLLPLLYFDCNGKENLTPHMREVQKWGTIRSEGGQKLWRYGDMEIYEYDLNHSLDSIVLVPLGWHKLWERWRCISFVRREPTEKVGSEHNVRRCQGTVSSYPSILMLPCFFEDQMLRVSNGNADYCTVYTDYPMPDQNNTICWYGVFAPYTLRYSIFPPLLLSSLPIKFSAERDTST